jgi:hypothetical protein
MSELWPVSRICLQPQALHYSYEKAGLQIHDQPIPWNAEAALVEARMVLPGTANRRKADFQLRLAGREPVAAQDLHRSEADHYYRISFRFEPPRTTTTAEVLYRNHLLGQMTLPVLGREEFLQEVRLQLPTLFVRLGEQSVACQTFVATQSKGLLASGVLVSPTSLVPLLDLDLQVEFHNERGGSGITLPARLASSQLAGRTALVTVVPPRFPRRLGSWLVNWSLSGRSLASQRIRAISVRTFQRSLRVTDSRFVLRWPNGEMNLARQVPPVEKPVRLGPCFLVSSREPGMAALCDLQVRAQVAGSVQPPLLMEQAALITDGPTTFAPGTLDRADVAQVVAFELCLKGHSLGTLALCPAPAATFTSEGGFKAPHDFAWSASTEEELNERLQRLFDSEGK